MNTSNIIQADIFFFIASIGFVVMAIILAIVLFYAAKVARSMSRIVKRIELESEKVADDIENLRTRIKEEGQKVSGLGKWISAFLFGQAVYKKARKKKED